MTEYFKKLLSNNPPKKTEPIANPVSSTQTKAINVDAITPYNSQITASASQLTPYNRSNISNNTSSTFRNIIKFIHAPLKQFTRIIGHAVFASPEQLQHVINMTLGTAIVGSASTGVGIPIAAGITVCLLLINQLFILYYAQLELIETITHGTRVA